LAAALLISLTACQEQGSEPALVFEHRFPELTQGDALTAGLPAHAGSVYLVRVEGVQTEFESTIAVDGKELGTVRIPYLRAVPVFHLVEIPADSGATSEPATLTLTVRPLKFTNRGALMTRVYALAHQSRRDRRLIEAYRSYEAATQMTQDESSALWQKRVGMLRSASDAFEKLGETEASLWSGFLTAQFQYFPLGEYDAAAERAATIRRRSRALRISRVPCAEPWTIGRPTVRPVEPLNEPRGCCPRER
jgi:hypothetical protein